MTRYNGVEEGLDDVVGSTFFLGQILLDAAHKPRGEFSAVVILHHHVKLGLLHVA